MEEVKNMESVSNIKLAKFQVRFEMFYRQYMEEYVVLSMPFCLPISNKEKLSIYMKNPYISYFYEYCFKTVRYGAKTGPDLFVLTKQLEKLKNEESYECCREENNSMFHGEVTSVVLRNMFIFLALLMCTMDEEFYKNEVNMVADLATIFGFTEDMITDWVNAVKYFLDGNDFGEGMKLVLKTPEAKRFFRLG